VKNYIHVRECVYNIGHWPRYGLNFRKQPTLPKTSIIPNLNTDKAKYFKKIYYLHSKLQELQQEEG
jgi:hypothetical protein